MKAVPLAFAVALAAAAPNGTTAAPGDQSELLKAGSLRHLAGSDRSAGGGKAAPVTDGQDAKLQVAQGCISGYWRRC